MTTLNITLPDELQSFVDQQVTENGFETCNDYIRGLIRKERESPTPAGPADRGSGIASGSDRRRGIPRAAARTCARRRVGMSNKPVRLRRRAAREVEEALRRYRSEAPTGVALRFSDSFGEASRHIGRHPQSGSLRYAESGRLASLRFWRVKGFPYLIFYVERDAVIDVLRVLHTARDIPESLSETLEEW